MIVTASDAQVTSAATVTTPIIHYDTTGGGRNFFQTSGDASANGGVRLDFDLKKGNPSASLLDRFGRIKTMDIRKMTGETVSTIHKYEYGYDANGNRTYALIEQAGHPGDRSYLYGYDRLNRLIYAERGVLNGTNDGILDGGKGRAWGLDLLGNWSGDLDAGASGNQSVVDYTTQTIGPPAHGYTPGTDVPDAFTQHDTDESNAIKTYSYDDDGDPATAPENSDFHYDDAGNLVLDDKKFYKYDAWNRIVAVWDKGELGIVGSALDGTLGDLVATYDYDALGRRIAKTLGTATSPTDYFYYDGHRVIEHHTDDGTGVAFNKQYVYGLNYIDEPVAYYENDGTGSPTATPHFILQDANYDVVGITDDQGTLVQQMTYDPYGIHLYIEDGNGAIYGIVDADLAELLIALGRNGLWYDRETGLYYVRARYYDPALGRWRQRDPIQTALLHVNGLQRNGQSQRLRLAIGDVHSSTSTHLYEYSYSDPSEYSDPTGLEPVEPCRVQIRLGHEEGPNKVIRLSAGESECSAWGMFMCNADKYNFEKCFDEDKNPVPCAVDDLVAKRGLIPRFPSIDDTIGPGKKDEKGIFLQTLDTAINRAGARAKEIAEDCKSECKVIQVILQCDFVPMEGDKNAGWYRKWCKPQTMAVNVDGSWAKDQAKWRGYINPVRCKKNRKP